MRIGIGARKSDKAAKVGKASGLEKKLLQLCKDFKRFGVHGVQRIRHQSRPARGPIEVVNQHELPSLCDLAGNAFADVRGEGCPAYGVVAVIVPVEHCHVVFSMNLEFASCL